MVQTRKFSQFNGPDPIQSTDIVVGLRNGDNWQFTGFGSSGGASVYTIVQNNHNLLPGNWVRVDGTGNFVKALSDTPEHAEVVGVVIEKVSANEFILQTEGLLQRTDVFSGLTIGRVYFLSDVTSGLMVLNDNFQAEEVSIPLFIALTAETGFIRQFRGFQNSNQFFGGLEPPADTPVIEIINQSLHGFSVGQVVYNDALNHYALAKSDGSLVNGEQGLGFVVNPVTANSFALQQSGWTQDLSGLSQGIYYLSSTVLGGITQVAPTANGTYNKPMLAAVNANGGWILPQRPIINGASNNPNVKVFVQANAFSKGHVVRVSGLNTYSLAQADSAVNANAIGFVTAANPAQFTLQQSGYFDDFPNPMPGGVVLAANTRYWLSATNAGQLVSIEPASPNYSKPMLTTDSLTTGWIQEQRALINSGGGGGGAGPVLLASLPAAGVAVDFDDGAFPGLFDNSWDAYTIVGVGIVFDIECYPYFRLREGGVFRTQDYNSTPANGTANYNDEIGPWPNTTAATGVDAVYMSNNKKIDTLTNRSYLNFVIKVGQPFTSRYKVWYSACNYGNTAGGGIQTEHARGGYAANNNPITGIRFFATAAANVSGGAATFLGGTINIYGQNFDPLM